MALAPTARKCAVSSAEPLLPDKLEVSPMNQRGRAERLIAVPALTVRTGQCSELSP